MSRFSVFDKLIHIHMVRPTLTHARSPLVKHAHELANRIPSLGGEVKAMLAGIPICGTKKIRKSSSIEIVTNRILASLQTGGNIRWTTLDTRGVTTHQAHGGMARSIYAVEQA
ncbi:hypothetical protein RRG08_043948 [Elysia crispata]|uniref:Uncharacterized protein n=1 Tax=Elysia crispata TaxID=231223 RepID=A0AAE0Y0J1_9GAST|nr:hypothetical protein RRG08_043948 [Elysia crispata]